MKLTNIWYYQKSLDVLCTEHLDLNVHVQVQYFLREIQQDLMPNTIVEKSIPGSQEVI